MKKVLFALAMSAVLIGSGCDSSKDASADAASSSDGGLDANLDATVSWDADFSIDKGFIGDPESCSEAALTKTYVGCDFWPTVLPNTVGTPFDFTVVVSNAGDTVAQVTIELGGQQIVTGDVQPSGLKKFYLPWVDDLKHWNNPCQTGFTPVPPFASKRVAAGAYHLTSTVPVTVFQFNPLEYDPKGGPEGKDWSGCQACLEGCHSWTNDASLLLPSTAATGNYRITGPAGQNDGTIEDPGYFSVTGLEDGTQVQIQIGETGKVTGGGGIPSLGPKETFSFPVDRGDVVLIVGTITSDLSGSVINADKPIQVMSGAACQQKPDTVVACDHMEETVFPAETLGKHYFVAVPTNARGVPIGHIVRLYGNVDKTTLSYPSGSPPSAPSMIHAGKVYDLGVIDSDFEVQGDRAFAVTSFLLGSSMSDPGHTIDRQGDPGQTNIMSVEQYRKKYVFLAPDDYDFSFADIIAPGGAKLVLDGSPVAEQPSPISSGYAVVRVQLGPGNDGAHVLESDLPVGLQVMGYGFATSYYYPGGLNLIPIAPPPVIE